VSANDNVKTIQSVYEAFGRGDVAAILEVLTDDVDWASEAADASGAPWYGVHHGRDGVAGFFEAFGSTMEVEEFTPSVFAATDTEVLTIVRFRARTRAGDVRLRWTSTTASRSATGRSRTTAAPRTPSRP
jgi:ketosteroid isomerase-like protein